MIETMNCSLIVRDPAGDLTFVKETLLRWLGYTGNELLGRPAEDFAPADLRDVLREETKATQDGDLRVRLAVLLRKDGTTFPTLVVPQRFFDELGRLDGTFAVVVDLGAVQTAKPVRYEGGDLLRESIDRIAVELHIGPHTVRRNLKSMYRKLCVSTQSELIQTVRWLTTQGVSAVAPHGGTSAPRKG